MNNRKSSLSMFFVLLITCSFYAQKQPSNKDFTTVSSTDFVRCATVAYQEKLDQKNLNQAATKTFESWMSSKMNQVKKSRVNGKVAAQEYTIPVVVHVVHNGDEINRIGNVVGENISDAQVISQIEVLNQDYRKIEGTPGGVNSTGVAVDVSINFVLAKQDPDGLETTGIVRHNINPYHDDVENEPINSVGGGGADWETYEDVQDLKEATQWDPKKYLNIWTIRTGGESVDDGEGLNDLLGYAQFPSSSNLSGLNSNGGSSLTDGVVISFHAFGDSKQTDGSFIMNNVYNEGRTTTHEIGHWLGLRHIWGDAQAGQNGCNVDDFCLDTPNAEDANYDCNRVYDSCSGDGLGNDMVENYMDYTNDACMDTFTQDQKDRMITVLENSPRRVELLTSIALEKPFSKEQLEAFVVDPSLLQADNKITTIAGYADEEVTISVYDSSGKLLFNVTYTNVDNIFSEEIDLSSLFSGVYVLLIENQGRKVVKRVIIK